MDPQARIEALEREIEELRGQLARETREDPELRVALVERERLLREAERIVHLGSWVWHPATEAIRWSDELYRIFGREPQSERPTVEGFFGAIHPDDVERVREVAGRGLASGSPEPVDFRVVRADGTVRDVHMEAAVVGSGEGMRFVGTVLDVTDALELERRLRHTQKMEALGTLAGGVAHDFNNYLQVIVGYADRIATDPSRLEGVIRSIAHIRDAAGRCERLTRQLLAFGRHSTFSPELVELDELVDELVLMLEPSLGERIVVRRARSGTPALVAADRASIEQAVVNLVVNARDAMPDGGFLTIETGSTVVGPEETALPPGRYVTLTVGDEGVGIPPHILPRIFEPFFSTKPKGRGTGLGLSSAYGIVEQSGGTIRVESRPGEGTRFRVYLPHAEGIPSRAGIAAPPTRGTILVVEDQPDVRELVRMQLEDAGYRVLEAEHGRAALAVVDEHRRIDLVLTDVVMPELSGPGLARELVGLRPDLPILFMSGYADPTDELLSGPLLKKPFPREELLEALAERLRR
ncbi:MAG: ATP-binding protein [Polyangiales bacterium]